jgi:hypothetical protein
VLRHELILLQLRDIAVDAEPELILQVHDIAVGTEFELILLRLQGIAVGAEA